MYGIRAKAVFGLLASAGLSIAAQGDTACSDLMCVSANVNSNNTVTYVLQSTGMADLGWMAIGFGKQMSGSPMVIMWPNDDMSITLSQRKAPSEVMPTQDASPPRPATLALEDSDPADCMHPKLAFTIPANGDTIQTLIWGFSNVTVDSSAVDTTLQPHIAMGTYTLNLQNNAASLNPANQNAPLASASGSDSASVSATMTASTSVGSPSQTGAATELKTLGKNVFLVGVLSIAVFTPFF